MTLVERITALLAMLSWFLKVVYFQAHLSKNVSKDPLWGIFWHFRRFGKRFGGTWRMIALSRCLFDKVHRSQAATFCLKYHPPFDISEHHWTPWNPVTFYKKKKSHFTVYRLHLSWCNSVQLRGSSHDSGMTFRSSSFHRHIFFSIFSHDTETKLAEQDKLCHVNVERTSCSGMKVIWEWDWYWYHVNSP